MDISRTETLPLIKAKLFVFDQLVPERQGAEFGEDELAGVSHECMKYNGFECSFFDSLFIYFFLPSFLEDLPRVLAAYRFVTKVTSVS